MKNLLPLFLMSFAVSVLGADAEKPMPTTVKVPGGAMFDITAPEGWTVETIQPDPALPPTVSLSTANHDTNLRLTFIPDPNGAFATKGKMEEVMKQTAQQYVEGSVEKKLKTEKFDSKNGTCLFAEFTDADLVGKKAEAGQYKVVGTGLMAFGNTVAAVTLLGDSLTDKSYLAGKETIKTGVKARK